MATRTNYFIQAILDHIYLNVSIANIGGGLPASSSVGNIYVALMTDLGEADYTDYVRIAIPRSSQGFSRTGNTVINAATVYFPKCTGGNNTITKIALYDSLTGGNKLHEQVLTDNIPVVTNVQPIIEPGYLTITGN